MDKSEWRRKKYRLKVIGLVITLISSGFSIYIALHDHLKDDETGSISVTSSPIGADISLDGTYEGEAPKILEEVKQGPHTVTLTLAEHVDWYEDISVDADKTVSVSPT